MPTLEFDPIQHPGLILNREELDAIRIKIDTQAWAKEAFDKLITDADTYVSSNIVIPKQKGQWTHYYACKDDGTRLTTITDTEHKCLTCGKVYTGEVYDRSVITGKHIALGEAAKNLGLAYQLTGDEKYIPPTKQILLDYADIYLSFPLEDKLGKLNTGLAARVFATNLAESCWLVNICWAYDLIAETLTTEERQHICKDMHLHGSHRRQPRLWPTRRWPRPSRQTGHHSLRCGSRTCARSRFHPIRCTLTPRMVQNHALTQYHPRRSTTTSTLHG